MRVYALVLPALVLCVGLHATESPDDLQPVKPIQAQPAPARTKVSNTDEPTPPVGASMPGPSDVPAPGRITRAEEETPPTPVTSKNLPKGREPQVDLIGDKVDAAPTKTKGAFQVDIEDFEPPAGPISPRALKVYRMVADLKKNTDQLATDIENKGVEKTRMSYCAEAVEKTITDLAGVWADKGDFRDACASTKRAALVLEEELDNEIREWTHVRWSFNAYQKLVKALRRDAVAYANLEPAPLIVKKDGKEVIMDAPANTDPTVARKEAADARRKELEAQRKRLANDVENQRKAEDALINDKMRAGEK